MHASNGSLLQISNPVRTCDVLIVLYRVRFVHRIALARTLEVSCVPWSSCACSGGFVHVRVLFVVRSKQIMPEEEKGSTSHPRGKQWLTVDRAH